VREQSWGKGQEEKTYKCQKMPQGNERSDPIAVNRSAEDQVGDYLGEEIEQGKTTNLFKGESKLAHEGYIQQRSQVAGQGPYEISKVTGSNGAFVHVAEYTTSTDKMK
jgi:hypothetical protein